MKQPYDDIEKKYPIKYSDGSKGKFWWNLEDYLAEVIADGTKKLLEHQHGYPNGLTEKKWKVILTKINVAFEDYANTGGEFYRYAGGRVPPTLPFDTWKKKMNDKSYRNKYKLIPDKRKIKRFEEAKMLLVKYFDMLWD